MELCVPQQCWLPWPSQTQQLHGRCTKPGNLCQTEGQDHPKQLDSWPVHSDWCGQPWSSLHQDSWDGCWWRGELWGAAIHSNYLQTFFNMTQYPTSLPKVFLFNPWWKDQLVNSICCAWDADLLTSLTSKTSLIILLSQKDQVKGTTVLVC